MVARRLLPNSCITNSNEFGPLGLKDYGSSTLRSKFDPFLSLDCAGLEGERIKLCHLASVSVSSSTFKNELIISELEFTKSQKSDREAHPSLDLHSLCLQRETRHLFFLHGSQSAPQTPSHSWPHRRRRLHFSWKKQKSLLLDEGNCSMDMRCDDYENASEVLF